jgi:LysM repeat protein
MSDNISAPPAAKLRFIDLMVLVVFISTAVLGLLLFRADLMRTIEARDAESIGIIIIRNNVVQRRHDDRVLWDRLYVDSPVYSGDLIRTAELSDASIHLDLNQIDVNENTLIRIQKSSGGRGPFEVELREGDLNVISSTESTGLMLELMGRQVEIDPGAVINAAAGEEGISVQVNEGSAVFKSEGQASEIAGGSMILMDTAGVVRIEPAAVVTRPKPGARYLKSTPEALPVNFAWNTINIPAADTVRLEIASDRNFTQDYSVIENLTNSAQAAFNAGIWYWKLSYGGTALRSGQLTVVDAAGPELFSPVMDSRFRYFGSATPQIRFQWTNIRESSQYIIEIGDTPDLANPKIRRQLSGASFIQSELGPGTWYWRVKPVFLSLYEGESAFSPVSLFRIEKLSEPPAAGTAITVEIPEAPVRTFTAPPDRPRETRRVMHPQADMAAVAAAAVAPVQVLEQPVKNPGRYHVVKRGDTLNRIAAQWYGTDTLFMHIVRENGIEDPDLIEIGEVFYIP